MIRLALFAIPLILLASKYGKPYLENLSNDISIKVVGFDLPQLGEKMLFPIRVKFHNPTVVAVNVANLVLQVYKATSNNQWQPVATTGEIAPFTLQSGNTVIPVSATISIKNLWGSWTDQLAYFNGVGQSFKIIATGKIKGIPFTYQTIESVHV